MYATEQRLASAQQLCDDLETTCAQQVAKLRSWEHRHNETIESVTAESAEAWAVVSELQDDNSRLGSELAAAVEVRAVGHAHGSRR